MPTSRLRVNVSATFVGNVLFAGSQWILLVVLARLGDAGEVGLFALGLAVTAPIFAFAGLDLDSIQASDASGQYRFSHYLGLRCVAVPVAAVASVVAAAAVSGATPSVFWVIVALAGSKSVELFGFTARGLYHRLEKMHLTAVSMIVRGWSGAMVFAMVYAATGGLALSVTALALTWLGVVMLVDGRRVVKLLRLESPDQAERGPLAVLRPSLDRRVLTALFVLALPAAVSTTVATLTVQAPRYALEIHVDTAALGIFASLAYTVKVVEMVSAALGTAMMPRLAKQFVARRWKGFSHVLTRMLLGAIVLGSLGIILAVLVGEPALRFVYGPEFARGDTLTRLMVASLFVMVAKLLGAALMSMRVLKLRMGVFVVTLGLVALAAAVLVPTRGINGAAESLIVGFSWRCLASGALVVYYFRRAVRISAQP